MPAYIVRTIEELRLVGIFVARSPSDLFTVVEESLNRLGRAFLVLQGEVKRLLFVE